MVARRDRHSSGPPSPIRHLSIDRYFLIMPWAPRERIMNFLDIGPGGHGPSRRLGEAGDDTRLAIRLAFLCSSRNGGPGDEYARARPALIAHLPPIVLVVRCGDVM